MVVTKVIGYFCYSVLLLWRNFFCSALITLLCTGRGGSIETLDSLNATKRSALKMLQHEKVNMTLLISAKST